jgi:membrane-bound metal-dependent hydrolase YbcI (DUF457 family)
MTVYEHTMVGVNFALAAGLQRRFGWGIAVASALAAAVPDWDGLSILFGSAAYATVHRTWGHSVLTASLLGAAIGVVAYYGACPALLRRLGARFGFQSRLATAPVRSWIGPVVWLTVGVVAAMSHLLADLFYASGDKGLAAWPVQLFWPFSSRGWVFPTVPYGDLATTLLFVAEMFALYRWPKRTQLLAQISLAVVVLYVAARWYRT